jgi:hypothetical protein
MKQTSLLFLVVFTSCCCYSQSKQSENHNGHHAAQSANPRSYADSVNAGIIQKDTLKSSVFRMAMDYVGKNHVISNTVHLEFAVAPSGAVLSRMTRYG